LPIDFSGDPENCGSCGNRCDFEVCDRGDCASVTLGSSQLAGGKELFPANEYRCVDVATADPLRLKGLGIDTSVEGIHLRLALFSGEAAGMRLIVETEELRSSDDGTVAEVAELLVPAGEYFLCLVAEESVHAYYKTGTKFEVAPLPYGEFPMEAPLTSSFVGSSPRVFAVGFID
jgi:hypothetical protein